MGKTEFLIIFVAIVFGFAISEYLKGVMFLIKTKKKVKESLPHISWQILTLVMAIQFWWTFYAYSSGVKLNLLTFILILGIPFLYYMIIMLLFPSNEEIDENNGDMIQYFNKKRTNLYIAIGVLFFLYSLTGILWLNESIFNTNVIVRSLVIILAITAVFIKKSIADYILILTVFVIMIVFYVKRFEINETSSKSSPDCECCLELLEEKGYILPLGKEDHLPVENIVNSEVESSDTLITLPSIIEAESKILKRPTPKK